MSSSSNKFRLVLETVQSYNIQINVISKGRTQHSHIHCLLRLLLYTSNTRSPWLLKHVARSRFAASPASLLRHTFSIISSALYTVPKTLGVVMPLLLRVNELPVPARRGSQPRRTATPLCVVTLAAIFDELVARQSNRRDNARRRSRAAIQIPRQIDK